MRCTASRPRPEAPGPTPTVGEERASRPPREARDLGARTTRLHVGRPPETRSSGRTPCHPASRRRQCSHCRISHSPEQTTSTVGPPSGNHAPGEFEQSATPPPALGAKRRGPGDGPKQRRTERAPRAQAAVRVDFDGRSRSCPISGRSSASSGRTVLPPRRSSRSRSPSKPATAGATNTAACDGSARLPASSVRTTSTGRPHTRSTGSTNRGSAKQRRARRAAPHRLRPPRG